MALPTNVEASYADDDQDESVRLHQQHHDLIHAALNELPPTVIRTSGEWAAAAQVLGSGQFGVASDTGEVRAGDGANRWADLISPSARKVDEGTLVLNLRKQEGVRGDGVADDSAAINRAAETAATLGLRLFATGTFRINSTVNLACDTDLTGATFNYHGRGVAVEVGSTPVLFRKTIALPRVRCATKGQGPGWIIGSVGVRVVNVMSSIVTVMHIDGFETGLYVYGRGSGTAYCTFTIGHLENNKRNLVLGADSSGWSNQNTYIGGRYSHNSAEGKDLPGTRHILLEATVNPVNNNTWLNPSVEGATVEQQIDVDGGLLNQWINPRLERSLGGRIRWGPSASQNLILGGFQVATAQVTRVTGESRNSIQATDLFEVHGASRGPVMRLQNLYSDSAGALALYGTSSLAEADYRWRWSVATLEAKRVAEGHPRMVMDGTNGRYYVGTGAAAPVTYLAASGVTGLALHGGHLHFGADNANDIGGSSNQRPRDINVARNVNVGGALAVKGTVGFFGAFPGEKPVVNGSRSSGAALQSLIRALAKLGLLTDATTS